MYQKEADISSAQYCPSLPYWTDNAKDGTVGAQGSQNVRFGDTPGGPINAFAPGLYDFILLACDANDTTFQNALAQVDMTVQVVPEPQTLALFALGLGALAALRRRARSS